LASCCCCAPSTGPTGRCGATGGSGWGEAAGGAVVAPMQGATCCVVPPRVTRLRRSPWAGVSGPVGAHRGGQEGVGGACMDSMPPSVCRHRAGRRHHDHLRRAGWVARVDERTVRAHPAPPMVCDERPPAAARIPRAKPV
jgi:hypothetical protein